MKDLLDKGAVIQRDMETYAIAPHLIGGLITPKQLRDIADVAEKYNASAVKVTGAQRIAIVGIKEEDIDNAWLDLGMKPGAAIGLCVRTCPNRRSRSQARLCDYTRNPIANRARRLFLATVVVKTLQVSLLK